MKGKLITNGVLALVALVSFIMFMAAAFSTKGHYVTTGGGLYSYTHWQVDSYTNIWYGLFGVVVFSLTMIASFVMGIVTLATMHGDNRGLVVASGVLAILGGVFGVNAIISFLGAKNTV